MISLKLKRCKERNKITNSPQQWSRENHELR